ncbi:hypothetical protein HYC85_007432 [Camellia sinensis]|uniref:JAB1/MPN/MOV34 metalloenzyme domain-containing protein n=1 Tax=Camellia sinensis TaxID=4442 RepID=A0A7J7HR90_CAMSI|nr:hypothetical protein HYC85_007432 [Camellia sinensis]
MSCDHQILDTERERDRKFRARDCGPRMSLTSVKISEDVWLACLTHALSTETEEIMGLLLGDIQHSKNGSVTALIWGALPQPRCDRQKDRVETNPEQLTAASAQAEISFPCCFLCAHSC